MSKEGDGRLFFITGNIFDQKGVLVHQTRALSRNNAAAGIAKSVRFCLSVEPYPVSVIGKNLEMGSIRIDSVPAGSGGITHVVHLTGQLYSGHANSHGQDSSAARLVAFEKGLDTLLGHLKSERIDPTTILFPDHIGCGLAGGQWTLYRKLIADFSAMIPDGFDVKIVRLPKE